MEIGGCYGEKTMGYWGIFPAEYYQYWDGVPRPGWSGVGRLTHHQIFLFLQWAVDILQLKDLEKQVI